MRRMYSLNQLQEIALKKIESTTNLKVFENIVDKDGHKRFVEGSAGAKEITGITWSYQKWSLSGSHLMVVLAGTVADTTVLASGTTLAEVDIPKWIYDKLFPTFSNNLTITNVKYWGSDWTTQNADVSIKKQDDIIKFVQSNNLTLTAERMFRIELDLLIDNE